MTGNDRSAFCLSAASSTTHPTWDRAQISTMTDGQRTALATTREIMSGLMQLSSRYEWCEWLQTRGETELCFFKCWRFRTFSDCRFANICLGSKGIAFPSSSRVLL